MFHRVTAAIAEGKRPVPIPNPEAKPTSADGTALVTVWESRTPPDKHPEKRGPQQVPAFCVSGPRSTWLGGDAVGCAG